MLSSKPMQSDGAAPFHLVFISKAVELRAWRDLGRIVLP